MDIVKLIKTHEDYMEALQRVETLLEDENQMQGGELDILTYMIDVYEENCLVEDLNYDFELEVIKIHNDARILKKAHEPDAGFDIYAYLNLPLAIPPNGRVNIPSGIRILIPEGWMGVIENRSGLSTKQGLAKLAGIYDALYEGELHVCIHNTSDREYVVNHGDRVGQILFHKVPKVKITEVSEFSRSGTRSNNGFGSSGR